MEVVAFCSRTKIPRPLLDANYMLFAINNSTSAMYSRLSLNSI